MKGFIGPIGDDLPAIVIIIMALTLFFSGMAFTLKIYNDKVENINYLMGAIDISRVMLAYGKINSADVGTVANSGDFVAKSYGLRYDIQVHGATGYLPSDNCGEPSDYPVIFDFAIAYDNELKVLSLRVCR